MADHLPSINGAPYGVTVLRHWEDLPEGAARALGLQYRDAQAAATVVTGAVRLLTVVPGHDGRPVYALRGLRPDDARTLAHHLTAAADDYDQEAARD